ncbi:MAG: carbohydrate kinase [Planctomycetes bacterium]|nr:carbohydrate kinase [Planctomycetota bacterium]
MSPAAFTIVGLGEVLWDCFDDRRLPGGAPANVAFHAAQLGARGVVCSRVGDDAEGEELVRFLEGQGLDTSAIQIDSGRSTGRVTVDTSDPDRPVFTIHESVAWDEIACDETARDLMRRADAVCFGTLAQRSPQSREAIHQCLAATRPGCLKVYDVNLRQHWYERDRIERSLAAADVVKLNEHEVAVLGPLLGMGESFAAGSSDEAARSFARRLVESYRVAIVCVTRGERGCLALSASEDVVVPGRPVVTADAVGAGDAFTAALIVARLASWPLQRAIAFANQIGALVASHPGAMPPLETQFADLWRGAVKGSDPFADER